MVESECPAGYIVCLGISGLEIERGDRLSGGGGK